MDYLDYMEQQAKDIKALHKFKKSQVKKRMMGDKVSSRSVKSGYEQPIGTRSAMWL